MGRLAVTLFPGLTTLRGTHPEPKSGGPRRQRAYSNAYAPNPPRPPIPNPRLYCTWYATLISIVRGGKHARSLHAW